MRPQINLRARWLLAVAGALSMTMILAAGAPAAAQADSPGVKFAVKQTRLNVLAGRSVLVRGALRPGRSGRTVVLQVQGARGWTTVARTRTRIGGAFTLRDPRRETGSRRVRLRASLEAAAASGQAPAPAIRTLGRLNVYRHASVSWYGPGLYGSHLACGGSLGAGTLGVAHKTLPCGTKVTIRHRGRTVRVPVIDRGPFVGGREYDLTAATASRLGFSGAGMVWVTK